MTALEIALFAAGALFLAVSLGDSLWPMLKAKLRAGAERRTRDLRMEFLECSPRAIIVSVGALSGLSSAAVLAATRNPLLALAASCVVPFASGFAVRTIRKKRRERIVAQLSSLLDLLEGHVKAGHSLTEAFSDVAPLLPRGIREEIVWISRMNNLGTPLCEVLRLWEERMSCEEISILVRPLRIIVPAGGNIGNLLARTRDILRSRTARKEKMRSLTAQARFQAVVLTLLTPAFAAALSLVDPDFLPRLTGTSRGRLLIAAAFFLQACGWVCIRRILAVKP